MRVLELFSGSATFSRIARERGHDVRTLDFNPKYGADYCADITTWDAKAALGAWRPDVIWASPDCTCFSIANGGGLKNYWDERLSPISPKSKKAVEVVKATWAVIHQLRPQRYFMENPVGMLRSMPFMPRQRKTISYCSYGLRCQKPTDIWTDSTWIWRARHRCKGAAPCHVKSRKKGNYGDGSVMGGKSAYERAKLPEQLCLEIIEHLEHELIP